MYKKILVPLDGSKLAECALDHVKTIAAGCNVPEVIILRVVEPNPAVSEVLSEGAVIRGNVSLDAKPLEFGYAEDIVPVSSTREEVDARSFCQFPGKIIKRRQPYSATDKNLFTGVSDNVESLAEWPEEIEVVSMMKICKDFGPLPYNLIQYLQICLATGLRIF